LAASFIIGWRLCRRHERNCLTVRKVPPRRFAARLSVQDRLDACRCDRRSSLERCPDRRRMNHGETSNRDKFVPEMLGYAFKIRSRPP